METAPDRDQLAGSNGNREDAGPDELVERLTGRLWAARELQRELGERAEQGEERARVCRRKAAQLEDRLETVKGQVAIRDEELQAARRRIRHLRDRNDSAEEQTRQLQASVDRLNKEAAVERERHDRTLELIDSALAPVSKELDRAAASRSWRFGHGTMRFLRALTFRRTKGDRDALQKSVDRIEHARQAARSRRS